MILPDHLAPGLRAVFVGTAIGGPSAQRGHYYAGPGNKFWFLLHAAGLTPTLLTPEDDETLTRHGFGLTDLVKTENGRFSVAVDLDGFLGKIQRFEPDVVGFVSKNAATEFARAAGERHPTDWGPTAWPVGPAEGFVLPGTSGANNGMPLPLRIALWRDLADHLGHG